MAEACLPSQPLLSLSTSRHLMASPFWSRELSATAEAKEWMPWGYLENCLDHNRCWLQGSNASPLGVVDAQRNIPGPISGSVSTRRVGLTRNRHGSSRGGKPGQLEKLQIHLAFNGNVTFVVFMFLKKPGSWLPILDPKRGKQK